MNIEAQAQGSIVEEMLDIVSIHIQSSDQFVLLGCLYDKATGDAGCPS